MSSHDKGAIKTEYKLLYTKYKNLRVDEQYEKARTVLDNIIELLKANSNVFYEAEDQIRILTAFKWMTKYQEERYLQGGANRLVYFLSEAANSSTPSVCTGSCQGFEFVKCIRRHNILSRRQSEMCFNKLKYLSNALKIEAAIAARSFDFYQALEKRKDAVAIHEPVTRLSSKRNHLQHQRYLRYWHYVTQGYVFLNDGDFVHSKQAFDQAFEQAKLFSKKEKCFPNYFHDIRELQMHSIYLDALERIQLLKFSDACALFQKWLDSRLERKGKGDLRFDNVQIFNYVSRMLERIPQGHVEMSDWQLLGKLIDECYVARTTWALLERLHLLRGLSLRYHRDGKVHLINIITKWQLKREVRRLAKDWRLFIPDTVLLGEDRIAGLTRKVNFPSFIELFDHLDENNTKWREVLAQNLKNLLLLMADYEHRRYCHDQGQLDRVPDERMSISDVVQFIHSHLETRSPEKARIFQDALVSLDGVMLKIKSGSLSEAIRTQKRFFESIRFWPHTVFVERQIKIPKDIFFDEDIPKFPAWQISFLRLWSENTRILTFECPEKLEEKAFYYLRPRYNIKTGERYRVRHELFLQSNVPKWLCVFYENMFGCSRIEKKNFQDWIMQFSSTERLKACRLFDMLRIYNEKDIREAWLELYSKKLPPEAKTKRVAYFGLGHTAHSGYHALYYFRQAISNLSPGERSFEDEDAFREISELEKEDLARLNTVVFVDDFIGTGKQALDLFVKNDDSYFKKYKWLEDFTVYYCAIVGFEKSINTLRSELSGKLKGVFVSKVMYEKDRAFSEDNPIWESNQTREEVKYLAEDIGRAVLTGTKYKPQRDNLGYDGCQAMIVFHYNIPNDTLPIFWGPGKRNGRDWLPLQKRYEKHRSSST